jgi:cobalt-zinc-cadmium efflux system protein
VPPRPTILIGLVPFRVAPVPAHSRLGGARSSNVKDAYYEVASDALGSRGVLGVLGAGLLIITTGWRYAEPVVGVGIGLFIVPRTWKLLRQAIDVLLEGTPPHIALSEVERVMREVPSVQAVHDLHVWTLTSGKYAMSGHVVVNDLRETDRILPELHARLHERFGIDHTTIQPERPLLVKFGERHPGEHEDDAR